jgi:Uncharacterized conserved protein
VISDSRVRILARQDGVTAGLAEKNYVNSWVLYALYTSDLGESIVFKGGTALSKLYFPELWRFSEDLDFTATRQLPELRSRIEEALSDIEQQSGIRFEVSNAHRAGEPTEYVQVAVQYDAILGQRNTTDLDITFDESLAFDEVTHRHSMEDVPKFQLQTYSIEEIFVEKLRSLFQRARARDYYDIYRLLNQESFNDQEIRRALQMKADAHGVELGLENGIPQNDIEAVRAYWNRALDRLVTDKPEFDVVIAEINEYLDSLPE